MASTIYNRSEVCLSLFKDCLLNPRLMTDSWAEKQLTAFLLWATSLGACVQSRASADARLEGHEDIRTTILGLLDALQGSLERVNASIVKDSFPNIDADPNFKTDVEVALEYLITIAVVVRNAGPKYRDVRAEEFVKEDIHSEALRTETTEVVDSISVSGLYKRGHMVSMGVRDDQKMPEYLRSRLIECNVKRRSRIVHASHRSNKMRGRPPSMSRNIFPTEVNNTFGGSKRLDIPEVSPNITIVPPQVTDLGKAMTTALSQASTAPTPVDRDDLKLPYPINRGRELGPIVNTAGSFISGKLTMEYPQPPKVSIASSHFECSCCHLLLSIDNIEENLWRKHVKSDLRPYVCLMDNCVTPYETFADTKTWFIHMEAEHKKKIVQWTCSAGKHQLPVIFSAQSAFEDHMRQVHPKVATKSHLPIITKQTGGPAPEIYKHCPLCTWSPELDTDPVDVANDIDIKGMMDIDARHAQEANRTKLKIELQRHIGEHMQSIALRALPDVVFDSSEQSVRSRSSVCLSNDSRKSELSISQSEIQFLQNEDSMPTEDYPIDETEGEYWAPIYYKLSLDPKSPKPFNCPYHENELFVDRPKLFRQLMDMVDYSSHESSSESASTILIHGPRGVGKSELAVKYAHKIHRHRKDVAVLWFFGNTAADFEKSYLSPIENRLLLEENVDGLDWIMRANRWLQDEKNGAWLAVIDNACLDINTSSDEEESFWQLVCKAIPACLHGTLLITSRKRPRKGFRDYCTLEVGEMTTEESDTLLRAILPETTEEVAAALANIEERTPLALIKAVDKSYPGLSDTRIMLSSLWSGMTSRREIASDLGERFTDKDQQRENLEQGSQESPNNTMLSETALRQDHHSTVTGIDSLAQVENTQGKDDEAKRMHRQTSKSHETTLGKQHPDTLNSVSNLALELPSNISMALAPDNNISKPNSFIYWNSIPATVDGMLGGYSNISRADLKGSANFFTKLRREHPLSAQGMLLRGADCGAGIGRVAAGFLSTVCEIVDIVEPVEKFTKEAKDAKMIGEGNVGEIYISGLEGWEPAQKYDLIWNQWCLGHLTDRELVAYLERCKKAVRADGWIIVKENICTSRDGKDIFDETDSSVIRTKEKFKQIFEEAGINCVKTELQRGFPQSLYPVRFYALKP